MHRVQCFAAVIDADAARLDSMTTVARQTRTFVACRAALSTALVYKKECPTAKADGRRAKRRRMRLCVC